jgi:hypothetical protein
VLAGAILYAALAMPWGGVYRPSQAANVEVAASARTLTSVPTFTVTPALPAAVVTPKRSPTPSQPTPTGTRVVTDYVDHRATDQAIERASSQASIKAEVAVQLGLADPETIIVTNASTGPQVAGSPPHVAGGPARKVLAHYFAWYDADGWDDCNISAGDKPVQPYDSDDPATIARHIRSAMDMGLNGFTLHWFAPGNRTDLNFATLLAESEGRDFASTVVFSYHIWPGAPHNQQTIGDALSYILEQHAGHPNFLHWNGKPVIFFTDVYRTPRTLAGETPQQFWAAVRARVDPGRQSWWIAEGLDSSYLAVFDGLYVFKISHATSLDDYVKSPEWGAQVRAWARETGRPKLWIATISPGWDDLRAGCKPDVRVPNPAHRLDRAGGAVYAATFEAAVASNPDWLLLSSFNEWVEGSYIEPGLLYGDTYLQLTREFVRRFQDRSPPEK